MSGDDYKPILFDFFTKLQKKGFHLGFNDYELIFSALQGGFGIENEEKFKQLCKNLWLKKNKDKELFDSLLEDYLSAEKENAAFFYLLKDKNTTIEGKKQITKKDKVGVDGQLSEENNKKAQLFKKENDYYEKEDNIEIIKNEKIKLSVENSNDEEITYFENDYQKLLKESKFLLKTDYTNLQASRLRLIFRFLRKDEKTIDSNTIDIDKSVTKAAIMGGLLDVPVYIKKGINIQLIVVLIDHLGSMVTFQKKTDKLLSILYDEKILKIKLYYFYNVPHKVFFIDKSHSQSESKENVLLYIKNFRASILIISDAGATKGNFNPKRINDIKGFLQNAYKYTPQIVWINPMPSKRWHGNSAEFISTSVPMFEFTESGLNKAVKILTGKVKTVKTISDVI